MAKKPKKPKQEDLPEFIDRIEIRHTYTTEDRALLLDQVAQQERSLRNLEEQAKVSSQGYKHRIKQAKGLKDELLDKATNGYEMRPIDVKIRMDRKNGVKYIFDRNSEELIEEQKMTDSDYERLPIDAPEPPKHRPAPEDAGKLNVGEALEEAQEQVGQDEKETSETDS